MLTRFLPFRVGLIMSLAAAACAQSQPDYERPPVSYSATLAHDAVTRLQARLIAGTVVLVGDERRMFAAVLAELGVSPASQMLVFSRNSFQRTRIRPDRPRALYFSDSVYVGWVPGGLVEVTAVDPRLGPVFYTLTLPRARAAAPAIVRDADCLSCHGGTFVREIPGLFARSVFPDAGGDPLLRHGTQLVDDETPFSERWGGWYVTGYRGATPHRGNAFAAERGDQLVFVPSPARPLELSAFFDTAAYLSPRSDATALLIFEHQMSVQNSLTRAAFAVRRMVDYQHSLQKAFKEPQTDEPAYDSVRGVLAHSVEDIVDHLLFRNAAPLPPGIEGDAGFRDAFMRGARRTRAGDSLRDLQLGDRLFAWRCSYLIYAESFHALPHILKRGVLDRLAAVLRNSEPLDRYAYLPAQEKRRIYEILLETHSDARDRWTEAAAVPEAR